MNKAAGLLTKRAAVFALTNVEAEGEGFDPDEDTGQNVVFLW